jgi:hypothetical protein
VSDYRPRQGENYLGLILPAMLELIRFVVHDEPGYYESMGYSNSADPWKEERFEEN